jgi:hypothetical protein
MVSHSDVVNKFEKLGYTRYFKSWLTRNKLKHIGRGNTSNVYSSKKLEFVVKLVLDGELLDFPKHSRHPLYKRWIKPLFVSKCRKMMIQPKASTRYIDRTKALRILKHIFGNKVDSYDVHDENVGIYKGKAMIFDCGHYK